MRNELHYFIQFLLTINNFNNFIRCIYLQIIFFFNKNKARNTKMEIE